MKARSKAYSTAVVASSLLNKLAILVIRVFRGFLCRLWSESLQLQDSCQTPIARKMKWFQSDLITILIIIWLTLRSCIIYCRLAHKKCSLGKPNEHYRLKKSEVELFRLRPIFHLACSAFNQLIQSCFNVEVSRCAERTRSVTCIAVNISDAIYSRQGLLHGRRTATSGHAWKLK